MKRKKREAKYAHVRVKRLKIADLQESPYNARSISGDALQGLAHSIEKFGLLAYPIVNMRKDGPRIVGGHQRLKALLDRGEEEVDCLVVKFDEKREKRANFALNNRAIQGSFVPELTRQLLSDIEEALGDNAQKALRALRFDQLLKETLRNLRWITGIDDAETKGKTDEDDIPRLVRTKAVSLPGRFYQLGKHVIACMSVQKPGSLQGFPVKSADMAFTRIAEKKQVNENFLNVFLQHLLDNTDGNIYVATNLLTLPVLQRRFSALGGHWSNTLVWVLPDCKGTANQAYREATVPVIYGWRDGTPRYFRARNLAKGERNLSNLFRLKRSPKVDLPVEIVAQAIRDSTKTGNTVLDTDLGRGATLIAAEKLGRCLIGYSRTARACDLVRRRWARFVHGGGAKWEAVTPMLD